MLDAVEVHPFFFLSDWHGSKVSFGIITWCPAEPKSPREEEWLQRKQPRDQGWPSAGTIGWAETEGEFGRDSGGRVSKAW